MEQLKFPIPEDWFLKGLSETDVASKINYRGTQYRCTIDYRQRVLTVGNVGEAERADVAQLLFELYGFRKLENAKGTRSLVGRLMAGIHAFMVGRNPHSK